VGGNRILDRTKAREKKRSRTRKRYIIQSATGTRQEGSYRDHYTLLQEKGFLQDREGKATAQANELLDQDFDPAPLTKGANHSGINLVELKLIRVRLWRGGRTSPSKPVTQQKLGQCGEKQTPVEGIHHLNLGQAQTRSAHPGGVAKGSRGRV